MDNHLATSYTVPKSWDSKSIFINTVPKSGSMFIFDKLSNGLRSYKVRAIASPNFPDCDIEVDRFYPFLTEDSLCQTHTPATPYNCYVLNQFLDKMILHVRDIRQSLLSWTHHIDKLISSSMTETGEITSANIHLFRCYPVPPLEYVKWPLEKKIDWMIENNYPHYVNWLVGWVKFLKAERKIDILVTQFDEFDDEAAFFKRISDFCGIENQLKYEPTVDKTQVTHFRSGKKDEWREVYTTAQQEKVTRMIPDEVYEYFGWSR